MKLKQIKRGEVDPEEMYIEYECPCGKGKILEYKCRTPGFKSHEFYILCKECENKYQPINNSGYFNEVKERI